MNTLHTVQKQELLKFRPSLTLAQIHRIIELTNLFVDVGSDGKKEELDKSIRRVCVPLLAKVEVGAINPSHTLSERHQEKLHQSAQQKRYDAGEMSREEEREFESKVLGI